MTGHYLDTSRKGAMILMNRTHFQRLAIALVAMAAVLLVSGRALAADSALPSPFTLYSFDAFPKNVAVESPVAIWFTFPDANKVGVVTLDGGQIQAATRVEAVYPRHKR